MGVMRGGIICESLRPGTVLDDIPMMVTRWSRYEVQNVPDYQPSCWTLIEFEAPDDDSSRLAATLSTALLEPGWYANWNTDDEAIVVFPSKVFRYRRGDSKGREAAQAYGRRCGVPEPQLDWSD
jgi:hypothetical protein